MTGEKDKALCTPSLETCMSCRHKDCIRTERGSTKDVNADLYIRMKDGIPMTKNLRPKKRKKTYAKRKCC